jgi:glycosyltransferase involved in cell wall biosynthesis
VVIPLLDGATHVAEAVKSVLAQSWSDLELIVVDDGSRDRGPDIVHRLAPRATILTRSHTGVASARNLGVEAAEGEYLLFLDADDVLPEESVALRMSPLERDPTLAAVFGRMEEFVSVGSSVDPPVRLRRPVGPTDARLAGTMLIRRGAFVELGGFDPRVGRWYFMAWLARFSASDLAWSQIPDVVLRRRLHATNTGLTLGTQAPELLGILRSALSRAEARRGDGPRGRSTGDA